MESAEPEHRSLYPISPCDTCHRRKVRCDRRKPCGNCIDRNLICLRQRNRQRLPKRTWTSRATAAPNTALPVTSPGNTHLCNDEAEHRDARSLGICATRTEPQASSESQFTVWAPSIRAIETNFNFLNSQNNHDSVEQRLIREAQQALQSALVNATPAVPASKAGSSPDGDGTEPLGSLSVDFLAWMLQDIGSDKAGIYVWDYLKHVSKPTLKRMGLSLLSNKASIDERDIFTVCLSGSAHKFLKTMLASREHDDELADHMQQRTMMYRWNALKALERIRLMATPSLALLQAILWGIFIYQGSGNTTIAYNLTRTACRVARDLGLHKFRPGGSCTTEEESFCVLWCYMLDQNYAWKFETSQRYFDPEPGVIDQLIRGTASELLNIYLIMAQIQDATLSSSKTTSFAASRSTSQILGQSVGQLLAMMDEVQNRIQQIASTPPNFWRGLNPTNEIAALQFALNSIRTTVFYLSEHPPILPLGFGESLLRSARQELSSLVAICLIRDKHNAVAFLHWTLMYYPLTAWFVLFCNSITSGHYEDLGLLKTMASVLMPNVEFSHPVTVLQRLCGDFIALSQSHLAIMGGDADISPGNTSCLLQSVASQHQSDVHSVVGSFPGSTPGLFASDLYVMDPTNGCGDANAFEFSSDTLALDLSNDAFLSGTT